MEASELEARYFQADVYDTLQNRIRRVEMREQAFAQKDKRALARFARRAETEFRSLNRHVSQTFRDIAKMVSDPSKRPRAFSKELASDQVVQMFADTYVGPDRLRSVIYTLRDIRYKKDYSKDKAYAKIRRLADIWYRENYLSESQEPLREVLPEVLMQHLPSNIHVEVDDEGNIKRMTERFRNERETLAKKIEVQKALVERYNAIARQVKKDLRSSDERIRLAALITSILMETGIRPGKKGNSTLVVQGDDKVEVETFGAVTLGPQHVRFVRDGFVELEFVGKAGTVNMAQLSDSAVIKMLQTYVDQARSGGSPAVFVTKDGERFPYSSLDSYMRSRFKFLRSTDFRKLRSTEVALESLYDGQQALYKQIQQFVEEEADDLHGRVLEAINATIGSALEDAQKALSHEDVKTTVESYINPQVVLRFLSQGRIDRTMKEAVLTAQPTLAFSVENFIAQAMEGKEPLSLAASEHMRLARTDSLIDLLADLEGDMADEGVEVPD